MTSHPGLRSTRPRRGPTPRARRRTLLLLAVEVLVAVVGGWRLADSLTHEPGDVVVVDGATYGVSHVEQVSGLTTEDLSGMSHGIQGLVTDGEALVRVRITVTAPAGGGGVAYDPSRLLVFEPGSGPGHAPVGGSVASGHLAPGASVEGLLSYVLPRAGEEISLGVPGGQRIPLTRIDVAPKGAGAPAHDQGGMSGMSMDPSTPPDPSGDPNPGGPASPSSLASVATH